MSERRAREFYLPPNFHTGISVFGKSFAVANLAEGVIMALIPIILFYFVLPRSGVHIPIGTTNTIVTMTSAILGYLGVAGINGYTFTQFIKSILRYRKNKRVCYYNPRVKTEASPYSQKNLAEQMLPREKLEMFYKKVKSGYSAKQRESALDEEKYILSDRENMFFEEDSGVIDTPVEYMDNKEYKAYRKKLKQEERRRRKEEKKKRKQKGGAVNGRTGKAGKKEAVSKEKARK